MFGAVAIVSVGLAVANFELASTVHADPAWENNNGTNMASGVGSDTIQDVADGWTGADPYPGGNTNGTVFQISKAYMPLIAQGVQPLTGSGVCGGAAPQIPCPAATALNSVGGAVGSFDAITPTGTVAGPSCMTSKPGGQQFDRPNGSRAGVVALSDAVNGTLWISSQVSGNGQTTCETGTGVSVSGAIDFSRASSSFNTGTGTTLTYIPIGRDGVSYAYWAPAGATVADVATLANLSQAQLGAIYGSGTAGSFVIDGHPVESCALNAGSGTWGFFTGAIGVSKATALTSSSVCTPSASQVLEENGGNSFNTAAKSLGPALCTPGAAGNCDFAVVPFSAASFSAQANGAGLDRSNALRTDAATDFTSMSTGPVRRTNSNGDGVTTATSTTITSATANFDTTNDVGATVVGPGLPAGTRITSVTNATTAVLNNPATTTSEAARTVTDGNTTSGSTTVTSATAAFASPADVNQNIAGAGIPAGSTIVSVTNATTAVISQAATATSPRSVNDGVTTLNSTTISSATANFSAGDAGMSIAGAGIPTGTTILEGFGTTARISQAATLGGTAVTFNISQPSLTIGGATFVISPPPYIPFPAPGASPVPPLTGDTTFFNDPTFGRNVFIVVPTARIAHTGSSQSLLLKGLFADDSFSVNDATITANSNIITSPSGQFKTNAVGEDIGRVVTGPGIPTGDFIASITNSTTAVLETNANAGSAPQVVNDGATTATSNVVTSGTAGFTAASVGADISGAGIPVGSVITTFVNSTTVDISNNATATATGVTLTIGNTANTVTFGSKPGAVCSTTNQGTRATFGFQAVPASSGGCGSTSLKGPALAS
jgi:hypothetical protein